MTAILGGSTIAGAGRSTSADPVDPIVTTARRLGARPDAILTYAWAPNQIGFDDYSGNVDVYAASGADAYGISDESPYYALAPDTLTLNGLYTDDLQSTVGDVTVVVYYRSWGASADDATLATFGGSSSFEAGNIAWSLRVRNSNTQLEVESEVGNNTDRTFRLRVPEGLPRGTDTAVVYTRVGATGEARLYVVDAQIGIPTVLTGVTLQSDGSVLGQVASGATTSSLFIPLPSTGYLVSLVHVETRATPAIEIPDLVQGLTSPSPLPTQAQIAAMATADTVLLIHASEGTGDAGITDLVGDIDDSGGFTGGGASLRAFGDAYVAQGEHVADVSYDVLVGLIGLRMTFGFVYLGATNDSEYFVQASSGEAAANNYQIAARQINASSLEVVWERDAGVNESAVFPIGRTLSDGDYVTVIAERTLDGHISAIIDGVARTPSSSTGTIVGNTAETLPPTGGSTTQFYANGGLASGSTGANGLHYLHVEAIT